MADHARLSPSSASRWLRCPGSVQLCADIPDTSSPEASEGTAAHIISEECLWLGLDPWDYVGTEVAADGRIFKVTEEWARHLQPGIDRIRDLGGKFYGEHKVDLGRWLPGQFGTLDRGIVKKKLIVISDLKFGSGVPVSPVKNEQLMLYALGFWWNIARHLTDATDFLIIIDQPRCDGGGGEWRTTLDELLAFGKKVKKRGLETYESDAPLVAGLKQCRFCPAANANCCPAFTKFNFDLIGLKFKDLDDAIEMDIHPPLVKAERLTPDRRSFIVKHKSMFTKWLEIIHAETLADAIAGRPTPGLEVVVGRKGPRQWINPERAEARLLKMMGDDAYAKTLKSPTIISQELPESRFAKLKELITQSEGAPSLAPIGSGKTVIKPTIAKFKNLDETN